MYKPKICLKCGKVFQPRSSRSKLCDECKKKRKCKYCGKEFETHDVGRILRGWSNYCSLECFLKAKWGEKSRKVKLKCQYCGREFIVYKTEVDHGRKFCSKECYKKWKKDNWKPSEKQIEKLREVLKGKKPKNFYTHFLPNILNRKGRKLEEIFGEERAKEIKKRLREFRKNQVIPYRPTTPERMFIELCNIAKLPFKYVGNGKLWIGNKNPDFIDEKSKIVVEIFGEYWHKEEEIPVIKDYYRKYGWECIVLWDYDVRRLLNLIKNQECCEMVKKRILKETRQLKLNFDQ